MARINRISITLCALLFTTLPLTPMAHASKQARESSATTHITKKADKKKSTATTKKTQKTAKKAASKSTTKIALCESQKCRVRNSCRRAQSEGAKSYESGNE